MAILIHFDYERDCFVRLKKLPKDLKKGQYVVSETLWEQYEKILEEFNRISSDLEAVEIALRSEFHRDQ